MIKASSSSAHLSNPVSRKRGFDSISDTAVDVKKEEAALKVCRCMQSFQARKNGFCEDLEYLQKNSRAPETERLTLNFLHRQWPLIDFYAKKPTSAVQKSSEAFFQHIKETYREKTYRITGEREGLYGRKLPKVEITPKEGFSGTLLQYMPEGKVEFKEGKAIQSKAEADYLVQNLSRMKEIPYNYKIGGCQYRAAFTGHILQHMGIPKSTLKKMWIAASRPNFLTWDSEDVPERFRRWKWHIAVSVTAENQEKYVIDPSLSPNRALSLEEWKGLMKGGITAECKEDELFYLAPGYSAKERSEKSQIRGNEGAQTLMYFYRHLAAVPFESQTRKILVNVYQNEMIPFSKAARNLAKG